MQLLHLEPELKFYHHHHLRFALTCRFVVVLFSEFHNYFFFSLFFFSRPKVIVIYFCTYFIMNLVCDDLTKYSLFNPVAKFKPWAWVAFVGTELTRRQQRALWWVCTAAPWSAFGRMLPAHGRRRCFLSTESREAHLEYYVQCWALLYKRTYWSESSKGALKLIKALDHLSCQERLRELGLSSLQKRRLRGDRITVYR